MKHMNFSHDSDFEFCSAGKAVTKNNSVYPRRRLDSAVLLIGISGEFPIWQNGQEYKLDKNSFMLHFPDCEHYGSGFATNMQSHFWCHFYLPPSCKIIGDEEELQQNESVVLPEYGTLKNIKPYHILFNQLIDAEYRDYENDMIRKNICDAYIKIMLNRLAADYREETLLKNINPEHYKRKILSSKVTEWIRVHASEKITARDVSEKFHYNTDYLTQVMKSQTGKTLTENINRAKVDEAKKLLLNTDMKIGEISDEVGFCDEKYFMKTFKKYENMTASEYRQSYFRTHISMNK